jgi:iron complex transport system substrate-binding protein
MGVSATRRGRAGARTICRGWALACLAWINMTGVVCEGRAANDRPAIAIVDDAGSAVSLPAPPRRIVSLLPSLTEAVCVLGACDRLIGVDRWSNWPQAQLARLPRLGSLDEAPLERIVALKPDLVLLAPSSRVAPRLRQLGLTVAELDARDLPEVESLLKKVATLLGQPEAGPRQWAKIRDELEAAAQSVPAQARGHAVYVEISSAPHAAGETSYIGQMLAQQGVRNIVPASLGPFPKLNPEFVVRARPELIVVAAGEVAALRRRPGWSAIPAVREQRICALKPKELDALSRPGPRLPEAARVLANCLSQAWGARP